MADGENLEKINLDQSSADDSMEEDIVEIKIVDSEQISSEVGEKTEEPHTKEPGLGLEGSSTALPSGIPSDAIEVSHGDKNKILDAPEKRKFQGIYHLCSVPPALILCDQHLLSVSFVFSIVRSILLNEQVSGYMYIILRNERLVMQKNTSVNDIMRVSICCFLMKMLITC